MYKPTITAVIVIIIIITITAAPLNVTVRTDGPLPFDDMVTGLL